MAYAGASSVSAPISFTWFALELITVFGLHLEAAVRLLLLAGLLVAAAATDLRRRRIPNELTLGGALAGALCQGWIAGTDGLLQALAGWGVGALIFMPGYLLGFTGAGDVKLMAATGTFLGPPGAVLAGAASILAGALIALVSLVWGSRGSGLSSPRRRYALMSRRWMKTGRPYSIKTDRSEVMGQRIPQGVAIAVGTAGVVVISLWFLSSGASVTG